jgi:hypothetical protein
MTAGIAAELCGAGSPASNTSMMRMAEPQHGHDLRAVGGSQAASSGSGTGGAEAPPIWWTPLLSSDGSGKVSNGPGTASVYR